MRPTNKTSTLTGKGIWPGVVAIAAVALVVLLFALPRDAARNAGSRPADQTTPAPTSTPNTRGK